MENQRTSLWQNFRLDLSPQDRTEKLNALYELLPSLCFKKSEKGWHWWTGMSWEFPGRQADRGPFTSMRQAEDALLVQSCICNSGRSVGGAPAYAEEKIFNRPIPSDPSRDCTAFRRDRYEVVEQGAGRYAVFNVTSEELVADDTNQTVIHRHDIAMHLQAVAPTASTALSTVRDLTNAYLLSKAEEMSQIDQLRGRHVIRPRPVPDIGELERALTSTPGATQQKVSGPDV